MHTAERRRFFVSVSMTVVGLIFYPRAVSRMSLPLSAMSTMGSCRAAAFVDEVERKRIVGTVGVEAFVALYTGFGRTTLHDVIAVTVRVEHGNEGESANLKHYPVS